MARNSTHSFLYIFTTFTILFCIPTILFSQSLANKLGAIETNYQFESLEKNLNVSFQVLQNRAVEKIKAGYSDDQSYGLGYSSIHLEFVTPNKIEIKEVKKEKIFRRSYYEIEFKDEKGAKILGIKSYDHISYQLNSNQGTEEFVYLMNLRGIPITILERAASINIFQVVEI